MKSILKVLALVVFAVVAIVVFAGCSGKSPAGKSTDLPSKDFQLEAATVEAESYVNQELPLPPWCAKNLGIVVDDKSPLVPVLKEAFPAKKGEFQTQVIPMQVTGATIIYEDAVCYGRYRVNANIHLYKDEFGVWKHELISGSMETLESRTK